MAEGTSLEGRVALVTGATSGLGAHFAGVLGRAGARVALVARSADRLAARVEILRAAGVEAEGFVADVTDRAAVEAAVAGAVAAFGGIDVLVNNAGIARTAWATRMTEEDWAAVVDTDLTAVWRVAQVAARAMQAQGRGGAIVNVASILGRVAQPTQANYAAAKAGVIMLTKVMARELARDGIRVNALCPGYFATEINRDFFASDAGQKLVGRLVPRRLGRLEELDGPLLLLCSAAGSFITGAEIVVDGGAELGGV